MIHLKNRLSGLLFCQVAMPNVFSPNVTIVGTQLGNNNEKVCDLCLPHYLKHKEIS